MSTIQELKDTILEVVRTEGDATFSRLEQLDGYKEPHWQPILLVPGAK